MKVKIEIDCSDVEEIYAHLNVIKTQIKKKVKKLWKQEPDKKWKPFIVEDNNCYGYHKAKIIDDLGPSTIKSGGTDMMDHGAY